MRKSILTVISSARDLLNKSLSFFLLSFCLIALSASNNKTTSYHCIKGDAKYQPAEYRNEFFIKEKYKLFFDSILRQPIYNCFCERKIKNLPTTYEKPRKNIAIHPDSAIATVAIEPVFIDLNTYDGLYEKRVWTKYGPNPRFRCGYWHYLFILSDGKYYDLTDDSLQNVKLARTKLVNSFSNKEIQGIVDWDIGHNIICSEASYNPPFLIKRDTVIIWDLNKEMGIE